ncbi:FAD dependent oxidoreductase [Violaceomyces palustris]|uniref:FAD dependent oxidoreductase n=1 Tax=Violaceomyces palustris TaxID=1673888 RepID=A0ACD0NXE4_9BASI|nr:FAD dependent oxidoreductase [Violaceomyces palustris]
MEGTLIKMEESRGGLKTPPPISRYSLITGRQAAPKPLLASLPTSKYAYKPPELSVDHLVIGGGVVGLAIASALSRRWPEKTTYLVERHPHIGQETSSRNSEVIHAGLYYPKDSFKTKLCVKGREMMYEYCKENQVPFKMTGKLVVGGKGSRAYLEKLDHHCKSLGTLSPPTKILSGDEARELEPDLGPEIEWALLSERTGIVSSHDLMASLEREIDENQSSEVVCSTSVVRIDPHMPDDVFPTSSSHGKRGRDQSQEGWVVQTVTSNDGLETDGQSDSLLARVVINSTGLNANLALNSLLKQMSDGEEAVAMYYSKGNYASYKGEGVKNVKRLLYPVPDMKGDAHSHTSLGTHLTLDLNGNVKFGPDTQWLSAPDPTSSIDFWEEKLVANEERLEEMHRDITRYLPNVRLEGLSPDYAGIRPKLIPPGGDKSFMDFQFLFHKSRELKLQKVWQNLYPSHLEGGGGLMISLLGIESPGLTSSLAIGETVKNWIARDVWGDEYHKNPPKNKGALNEEIGGGGADDWA